MTWTNFSGFPPTALPDIPANAIVVDSQSAMVYVGTDQGVYASKTNDFHGASWSLVGGGVGRRIPNAPVMGLQIFNDGGTKLLRAATYGRGVWEFVLSTDPDFQMAVGAPGQIVLAGFSAHFTGELTAINGYSDAVTLSCVVSGIQPNCTATPPLVTTIDGATFDVAASAPLGDYAFRLHAQGADAKLTAHDVALRLRLVGRRRTGHLHRARR